MIRKVLFVLTSHDELENTANKTGFMLYEFATPFYFLYDKGIEVTIVSPKGGQAAINAKSYITEGVTAATERFLTDEIIKNKLLNCNQIANIKELDYDAVFYPGGIGSLYDLASDKDSINLIEAFYRNNKPIAFVGMATAALQFAKNTLGEPLVKSKFVTGFSSDEIELLGLKTIIPIPVEVMLKEIGGSYSKSAENIPYSVTDGLLITGQNFASTLLVANKLLELL